MSRVYLDSNVYVYYFQGDPIFGSEAESIFRKLNGPAHELFASVFTLSELLVVPVRDHDEFTIARFKRFFRHPIVTVLPFTLVAAPIYANLRARQRVKPLDALHLACASTAGVDLFITNDLSLVGLSVPGIGAIVGLDTNF